MKTLILSDIHNKIEKAQEIIDEHPADRRVFLGDIYDDFGDSLQAIRRTAEWHKKALADPQNIFLMGNHDMFYRWPIRGLQCSGNNFDKSVVINSVLSQADWRQARFFCYLEDFLMTHAGLHPMFLQKGDVPVSKLRKMIEVAERALESQEGYVNQIFRAGEIRGGDHPTGGILWMDWTDFIPVEGLKQIVGHTPAKNVRERDGNWCLDTHLRHAAMLKDGKLEIFAT